MVELHHAGWECARAIRAGERADAVEHLHLCGAVPKESCAPSLCGGVFRGMRSLLETELKNPFGVCESGSDVVTVGADDVALRDLIHEVLSVLEKGTPCCQLERLRVRVPMVEVHHVRREHAATIEARDLAQLAKPGECLPLARRNPQDFGVAIVRLVRDVQCTLIPRFLHTAF